jgi:hypothetical protein
MTHARPPRRTAASRDPEQKRRRSSSPTAAPAPAKTDASKSSTLLGLQATLGNHVARRLLTTHAPAFLQRFVIRSNHDDPATVDIRRTGDGYMLKYFAAEAVIEFEKKRVDNRSVFFINWIYSGGVSGKGFGALLLWYALSNDNSSDLPVCGDPLGDSEGFWSKMGGTKVKPQARFTLDAATVKKNAGEAAAKAGWQLS